MARLRRQFGLGPDTQAGGSDYDRVKTLTAGIAPAPTEFWPVTGGTIEKNVERLSRAEEIRGYRASPAPRPWRARPELTIPVPAYLDIAIRALAWAFGAAAVRTGVAPAALTDRIRPLGYGAVVPPARFLEIVRDDLIYRVSGAQVNSVQLTMPLDGEASLEVGFMGLYYHLMPAATAVATPTFSLPERPLMLRDAKVFIDGAANPIPDLESVTFTFTNGFDSKWYAGRNRVPDTANPCQLVHFPAENRLKASQEVTTNLTLGNTSEAEEFKHDFSRASKAVYEIEECPMATVPVANRMLRITNAAQVYTGGGAGALSKAEDITSPFEGTVHYSDADGYDTQIEAVHTTPTLLAN